MDKTNLPKTYKYSLFGLMSVFLILIPILFFFAIWKSGFENSEQDIKQFLVFVFKQMVNMDYNWYNWLRLILIVLIFTATIAGYVDRWLAFLFTELTITENEFVLKNLFKQTTLGNDDILGFKFENKGYYIVSKDNPKKYLYVDLALNGSKEIVAYLNSNFTKLQ
jgi:hypothetical protein